jgi:MFS family permease
LGCLILAIVQGNSWDWGSPVIVSLLIAAFGLGGLFLLWEKRAAHPMLDLHLFHIRSFSAGSVMTTAGAIAMGGGMLMLVLFMVNELGFTALQAAIGMIPMAAVSFVLSPFAGRLVDIFGPRYLAAAGTALFGLAFLLFAQLDAEASLWSIGWREVVLGLGMSLSMPTLTAAGLTSLPHQAAGVGSGTMSTARAFGSALGVALVLAVYETVHDYSWPFVLSALIALASLPLSFLLGRRLGDELPER